MNIFHLLGLLCLLVLIYIIFLKQRQRRRIERFHEEEEEEEEEEEKEEKEEKAKCPLYVAVLASYDLPVYSSMIDFRRRQLDKYNVPHIFILDGPHPPQPLLSDEIFIPADTKLLEEKGLGRVPLTFAWIIFKLHMWAQDFIANDNLKHITHVLRTNVSTYVNMKELLRRLPTFSKTKCHLGTEFYNMSGVRYLSGTAVLYSRDVIEAFANIDIRENDEAFGLLDDAAMCAFLKPFPPRSAFPLNRVYAKDVQTKTEDKDIMFRIKDSRDRTIYDVKVWKALLKRYDDIIIP